MNSPRQTLAPLISSSCRGSSLSQPKSELATNEKEWDELASPSASLAFKPKQLNNNQNKVLTLIRATPCCRLLRHQHPIMLLNFNYGVIFIELGGYFLLSFQRQQGSLLSQQQILLLLTSSQASLATLDLRLKRSVGHTPPPSLGPSPGRPDESRKGDAGGSSLSTGPLAEAEEEQETWRGCWPLPQTCWGCPGRSRSYCWLRWPGTSSAPGTLGLASAVGGEDQRWGLEALRIIIGLGVSSEVLS